MALVKFKMYKMHQLNLGKPPTTTRNAKNGTRFWPFCDAFNASDFRNESRLLKPENHYSGMSHKTGKPLLSQFQRTAKHLLFCWVRDVTGKWRAKIHWSGQFIYIIKNLVFFSAICKWHNKVLPDILGWSPFHSPNFHSILTWTPSTMKSRLSNVHISLTFISRIRIHPRSLTWTHIDLDKVTILKGNSSFCRVCVFIFRSKETFFNPSNFL